MKVFLSHRMSGLTELEVMKIRDSAIKLLTEKYGKIDIIDNYHHENAPENAGRVWHLGISISQLDEADAIYFCDDSNSNGCLVEMLIAKLYNIRVLNSEMLKMVNPKDIDDDSIERILKNTKYDMTRYEMIEFIKNHPYVHISHTLFTDDEYIYSGSNGIIYDERGYIFEDWYSSTDIWSGSSGIRARIGGNWENGWYIKDKK